MARNEFLPTQQEVNEYLDYLRESGATNMFGSAPYVAREFDIPKRTAKEFVIRWMETYSDRHPH